VDGSAAGIGAGAGAAVSTGGTVSSGGGAVRSETTLHRPIKFMPAVYRRGVVRVGCGLMRKIHASLFALSMLAGCASEDDDRFACGDHGGSCDRATELCIVGGSDRCSTCVPLPAACEEDATCDCVPPGQDPAWGAYACEDAGMCTVDGGLVLTCAEITWGCG
jgi:hypothetical protein